MEVINQKLMMKLKQSRNPIFKSCHHHLERWVRHKFFVPRLKNKRATRVAKTYVLLGEGVDKLGQDLVADDGFGQLVGVVGETAEGQRGRLLDGGHIVQEKGSQESHNA